MRQKLNLLFVWLVLGGGASFSYSQESGDQIAVDSTDYQWVKVTTDAAFAPRDGAGALVFRGQMWLIGGWNPNPQYRSFFPLRCNNEVWTSRNGAEWTLVKPNTFRDQSFDATADWEGRHTGGYAVFQNRMWLVGGDSNQGHYHNDVWNSTDGKNWQLVNKEKPVPWGPRVLHYTVVHDDQIWVIGGQTLPNFAPAEEIFYDDIWVTRDGINWNQVKPRAPRWSPRGMIGGSAVFRGRIWMLGGGTYDTPQTPTRKFHNDVWSSADGVDWKRHIENAPWRPRQYHDVAVWDDRLWVLEGYRIDSGNLKDVWHSTDGIHWHEVADTPWKERHAASVFVYDDALWIAAGENMEPDVWKLQRK